MERLEATAPERYLPMRPPGPQPKLPSLAWAGMLALLALAVVAGLGWTVLSLRQAGEGSTPTAPNPDPSAKAEQTTDDGELKPAEAAEVLLMGNESRQSMAAGIATAVALTSQGASKRQLRRSSCRWK